MTPPLPPGDICPDCLYRPGGGVRWFCAAHARQLDLDEPLGVAVWVFFWFILGLAGLVVALVLAFLVL